MEFCRVCCHIVFNRIWAVRCTGFIREWCKRDFVTCIMQTVLHNSKVKYCICPNCHTLLSFQIYHWYDTPYIYLLYNLYSKCNILTVNIKNSFRDSLLEDTWWKYETSWSLRDDREELRKSSCCFPPSQRLLGDFTLHLYFLAGFCV